MSALKPTAAQLDDVFGALAHPVRRRILESTIPRGRRITELSDDFDITLAAVSKHIKVLERAGLISRQIVGRDHLIRARGDQLRAMRAWVDRQTTFWERALGRLKADLERMP